MGRNIIQAYNYQLLTLILLNLRKYLAFTINTVDYDKLFQLGRRGQVLRPTAGEVDHDLVHGLSRWSGIPVDYLYGERQITTGLYLTKSVGGQELRRLDDCVCEIRTLKKLNELWQDPMCLDEYVASGKRCDMSMIISALIFRLKRAGTLPEVPTIGDARNKAFKNYTPRLRELADAILEAEAAVPAQCNAKVAALSQDLSSLHFGEPFQKLVCKLAEAMA